MMYLCVISALQSLVFFHALDANMRQLFPMNLDSDFSEFSKLNAVFSTGYQIFVKHDSKKLRYELFIMMES